MQNYTPRLLNKFGFMSDEKEQELALFDKVTLQKLILRFELTRGSII